MVNSLAAADRVRAGRLRKLLRRSLGFRKRSAWGWVRTESEHATEFSEFNDVFEKTLFPGNYVFLEDGVLIRKQIGGSIPSLAISYSTPITYSESNP
jgi:hypothetical protein